jgi:preprotein translocase subunit SecF
MRRLRRLVPDDSNIPFMRLRRMALIGPAVVILPSLNDTAVGLGRARENLRKLSELLDRSINETLARAIMTSTTIFLAPLALFMFGGEVIRSLTFAMITYWTILIAAPVLIHLHLRGALGMEAASRPVG